MARLKVLFITAWYPHPENPVAGLFVRQHARAVQLHHDVVVVHCAGRARRLRPLWDMQRDAAESDAWGIPTYRLREAALPLGGSQAARAWGMLQAAAELSSAGFIPDVIHAHVYTVGLPAVLLGRRLHAPVLISEHSSEFARRLLPAARRWGARLAYRQATMVLPVSQALRESIEAYGIRARFRVVPNAIDTTVYCPSDAPPRTEPVKRLLFVGLLDSSHKKGFPVLLEALARINAWRADWRLDVIGDGPAREQYQQQAEALELGPNVTFHGATPPSETVRWMQQCDFLVLPSPYETFGVVLIEALACGVPVLATLGGGPAEIVTPEAGLLVPHSDAGALALGLEQMLDHAREYPAARLRAHVQAHYSLEAVGRELDRTYRMLLDEIEERRNARAASSGQ